jgi:hypothetical protein
MKLSSPSFKHESPIPQKFACDGDNVNPELIIEDVPIETKSLVLIFDDPDAPAGSANPGWVHWLIYNIEPCTNKINENSTPVGALQGENDWGNNEYGGPCPPAGTHHYVFTLYALNTELSISEGTTKFELLSGIKPHIIDQTKLIGTYTKS